MNNRYNSISVDGVSQSDPFGLNANGLPYLKSPISAETIADGTYPLTRTFYAVTRKKDALPETEALAAWLAGPEGQALVGKAGYVPIR